jgi:hypothetical protein
VTVLVAPFRRAELSGLIGDAPGSHPAPRTLFFEWLFFLVSLFLIVGEPWLKLRTNGFYDTQAFEAMALMTSPCQAYTL